MTSKTSMTRLWIFWGIFFGLILILPPSHAATLRLSWDGMGWDAVDYRIEIAEDAQFSKIIRSFSSRDSSTTFEVPDGLIVPKKAHARIQAQYRNKLKSRWYPLKFKKWAKPVIKEKRISIADSAVGGTRMSWNAPVDAGREPLLYRVQVLTYDELKVVHDSLLTQTEFELPPLPGGNFLLHVEAVGSQVLGTLHIEGTSIGKALIETEPVPYDPKTYGKDLPASFLEMTDAFYPGVKVSTGAKIQILGSTTKIDGDVALGLVGSGGTRFQATFPIVFIESGEFEAPRLGGDPFPSLSMGWLILGDSEFYLAPGLIVTIPFDSSENPPPHPLWGGFTLSGKKRLSRFAIGAEFIYLGSTSVETLKHSRIATTRLTGEREITNRWAAALETKWKVTGRAIKTHTLTLGPQGKRKLGKESWIILGPSLTFGPTENGNPFAFQASFTTIF